MNGTNLHSPVELQPEMHAESHLEEHPMSFFIQKDKIIRSESRYNAAPCFPLLCHIGDAPVRWREATSSCGDIRLSEENARQYRYLQEDAVSQ